MCTNVFFAAFGGALGAVLRAEQTSSAGDYHCCVAAKTGRYRGADGQKTNSRGFTQ